jgi:signal transduction histidine kinase
MKAGAYDFLPKPFSPDELRLIVRRGFERRHLQLESRRHEVERELQRRRFVTFVSHQLKTPLAAVHQYLDVLRQLGDDPEAAAKRRDWLGRCLARTDELRQIIDDWLTLAELQGGTFTRQRIRVDLKDVVARTVVASETLAAQANVTVSVELPAPAYPVRGDPTCVGVLLDNLVTNAIKYNRPGGRVSIRAAEERGEIVAEVTDTGVGVARSALPFLFEEFFRVRQAGRPKVEGTGLGLAICRRIATEMGGAIEVDSTEDVGSTFRIRLPAWADGADTPEPKTDA